MSDQKNDLVQREIIVARDALEAHAKDVKNALESLQQLARGATSIQQFRDLNGALGGFAPARKAVELGRKIVKGRLQSELNAATTTNKKTAEAE